MLTFILKFFHFNCSVCTEKTGNAEGRPDQHISIINIDMLEVFFKLMGFKTLSLLFWRTCFGSSF